MTAVRDYLLLSLTLALLVLLFLIATAPTDGVDVEVPTGTTWPNGPGDLTEVTP